MFREVTVANTKCVTYITQKWYFMTYIKNDGFDNLRGLAGNLEYSFIKTIYKY